MKKADAFGRFIFGVLIACLITAFVVLLGRDVWLAYSTDKIEQVTLTVEQAPVGMVEECVGGKVITKYKNYKFQRLDPKTMQPLTCESKGGIP
mgnify:CR=1 FL=1